jgi:threonine aldolase
MSTAPRKSFASDNFAGIHPEILRAISEANSGHVPSYGADPWTESAHAALRRHFGDDAQVALVFNGTAANVLALQAMNRPYEAVLCSKGAHITEDECGAPEKNTGCKLIGLPHQDGKLTIDAIRSGLTGVGRQHSVQPRTISLSQSTEFGAVYSLEEIRAISQFAREHDLYLHMDGARLANAAAHLGVGLREASRDCGVDALSFGGTKNGLMCGEAVVFFRPELAEGFQYIRKQGMQLASKMRFISAQMARLLEGDLWLRNATHANHMARLLAEKAAQVPGVNVLRPVQANGVFARLPENAIEPLQREYDFLVWDDRTREVRWMTSFDTTPEDVEGFVAALGRLAEA